MKITWLSIVKITLLVVFIVSFILIFSLSDSTEINLNNYKPSLPKIEVNQTNILFETDDYVVIKKVRRNNKIFTEGLFMDAENTLIESGGLYRKSKLHKFNINTPDEKVFEVDLADKYFGEGACLLKENIYQLTYREREM